MYTKIICALFCVAAAAAAAVPGDCVPGKDHSFRMGARVAGDRELYDKTLAVLSAGGPLDTEMNWETENGEKITYIKMIDENRYGVDGCVSVASGGVGQNNVVFHFTSPDGTVNFKTSIYGM